MLWKLGKNNEKGLTLIELMIVFAIIGIIVAIAIPSFLTYRTKGQDAAAITTAENFWNAGMAYFADTTTTGTQITGLQLHAMGQLPSNPDVIGNPTISDNAGVITLANPTFTFTGSGRVHTLNIDGTITSP